MIWEGPIQEGLLPTARATIYPVAGTLYLVGTPIGNLGDMTDRARETLAAVDLIAAEDTRRTGRLLSSFGIKTPLVSFFEGNERRRTDALLAELQAGRTLAVVSDAGMPGLSDPGFRLVRACVDAGIDVRVIPGPTAAVAALVVSGLSTDRFVFEGFLPRRSGDRRSRVESLAGERRTVVLFESARRLRGTLEELREVLGERRVAVVRELTKLHEEVLRGPVTGILESLSEREPKGEVVLVIEGAPEEIGPGDDALQAEARALVEAGSRKRDAAAEVAHRHGVSANRIYRLLVKE
jgi:16S rRNA (cytidine1402-2'-O)-methyltransferase